jgi:hypothetical protein
VLDLLVLALDLGVLLGQLLRLERQLLVGLLQLALLRLQLAGELLRLLAAAPSVRIVAFDAVQHDADAGRELLQERQVRGREAVERRPAPARP